MPRRPELVSGGAVAGAMLGPLDAGVVVVVAEIPQVVRADPETATRAGWKLALRVVSPARKIFTSLPEL